MARRCDRLLTRNFRCSPRLFVLCCCCCSSTVRRRLAPSPFAAIFVRIWVLAVDAGSHALAASRGHSVTTSSSLRRMRAGSATAENSPASESADQLTVLHLLHACVIRLRLRLVACSPSLSSSADVARVSFADAVPAAKPSRWWCRGSSFALLPDASGPIPDIVEHNLIAQIGRNPANRVGGPRPGCAR